MTAENYNFGRPNTRWLRAFEGIQAVRNSWAQVREMVSRKTEGIKRAITERDFLVLLLRVGKIFPAWLFRASTLVLTRAPLPLKAPELPAKIPVVCRVLARDEVLPVARLPRIEQSRPEDLQAEFRARLAQGLDGFVAEVDGQIVAYAWMQYGCYRAPAVSFDGVLQENEACSRDSYVDPAYRYKGVYVVLVNFLNQYLFDQGFRWLIGCGEHWNRHSIRTHQKLGYEIIGRILLLSLPFGSLQIRRLESESNRLRWKFLPRSRSKQ